MLSSPKNGWCAFTLNDFRGCPSYTTDVAMDTLTAFAEYYEKGVSVASYDEEGSEFILVLNKGCVHIIYTDNYDNVSFYDFPDVDINNLCNELIQDIESNIEAWANFTVDKHFSDINESYINANLIYLKELRKAVLEEE